MKPDQAIRLTLTSRGRELFGSEVETYLIRVDRHGIAQIVTEGAPFVQEDTKIVERWIHPLAEIGVGNREPMSKPQKMHPNERDLARRWQRHFGLTWTDAVAIARSPRCMAMSAQVDAWVASGEWIKTPIAELRRRVLAMLDEPSADATTVNVASEPPA